MLPRLPISAAVFDLTGLSYYTQIYVITALNLSRAWCPWGIAAALPLADRRRAILGEAAERHAHAGLTDVGSGDYVGKHWLGSFALYMLGCVPRQQPG